MSSSIVDEEGISNEVVAAETTTPPDQAAVTEPKKELTLKEQRIEEWFHLYGNLREFLNQKPTKHPLYEFAVKIMRNGESLDYYRGVYDALVKTMDLIPAAKQAEAQRAKAAGTDGFDQEAYESVIVDMLKLQIGLSMSRMLKRWPKEWQPEVEDKSKSIENKSSVVDPTRRDA